MKSNSIGDAVKYMLLRSSGERKYPTFNSTFLENLRKLRRSLSYEEWTFFETWMQQWYLMYLVQNPRTPEAIPEAEHKAHTGTSEPPKRNLPVELGASENLVYASTSYYSDSGPSFINETPSGSPVMTQCQERAQRHYLPGAYVPQCDGNGEYTPMQCWRGTGYCWCVYRNGTEIPETKARTRVYCSDFDEPMEEKAMFAYEN
ncbi:MHC class II protein binding [Pristimantis euphronides]